MLKKTKDLKFNLIELLLILVMAYTVAPVVSRFISSYLTTYFYMLVVLLAIVLIFCVRSGTSFENCVKIAFPFLCWKALEFFLLNDSMILWAYQVMLDILPLLVGYYLTNYCDKVSFFAKLIFVLCALTLVTTVIGCIQHPEAARYLATVEDSQAQEAVRYDWKNIGGYSFVYTIVLLHPVAILAYKRKKIKLISSILISVAVCVLTIYSEYTIAFLLSIFTCVLYFFKKDLKSSHLIGLLIGALLVFIVFSSLFSKALNSLAEIIGSDTMAERLQALAGGKTGLEETDDDRLSRYMRSLNTFLNNPLFGSFLDGGGNLGGHSFILDFIGRYGLIGLTLLFFMYRTVYRRFFAPYKRKEGYGYIIWIFVQTLLLSLINTGMWLPVLSVFVPAFLHAIYKEGVE